MAADGVTTIVSPVPASAPVQDPTYHLAVYPWGAGGLQLKWDEPPGGITAGSAIAETGPVEGSTGLTERLCGLALAPQLLFVFTVIAPLVVPAMTFSVFDTDPPVHPLGLVQV